LGLDGGPIEIDTDVKFLDHMLEAFAKHSGCALQLVARGDGLDNHHLIEDVGIALGKAIYEALGDKRGIARYGSMMVPLDDALIAGSIDLSGRSYLNFSVSFEGVENLGDFKTEMVREFFRAVVDNGKFNLHLIQMNGDVAHHLCEASFKAFAKAFQQAKALTGSDEILSTKGLLE
jgi:imidazoleglycerol-phosphate dehydratase